MNNHEKIESTSERPTAGSEPSAKKQQEDPEVPGIGSGSPRMPDYHAHDLALPGAVGGAECRNADQRPPIAVIVELAAGARDPLGHAVNTSL